jgi:hypothetical protein
MTVHRHIVTGSSPIVIARFGVFPLVIVLRVTL